MGFFKSKRDNDEPIKNVRISKKVQKINSYIAKDIVEKNGIRTIILIVQDVEYIHGKGSIVTGIVKSAPVFVGDNLFCSGLSLEVSAIEKDGNQVKAAQIGDNVKLVFKISSGMIEKGDVLEK